MKITLEQLNAISALPADVIEGEHDPVSAAAVRLLIELRLQEEGGAYQWDFLWCGPSCNYELLDRWHLTMQEKAGDVGSAPTVGAVWFALFERLIEEGAINNDPQVLQARVDMHLAAADLLFATGHAKLHGEEAIGDEAEAFLEGERNESDEPI